VTFSWLTFYQGFIANKNFGHPQTWIANNHSETSSSFGDKAPQWIPINPATNRAQEMINFII